jgi:DNA-directed RNA polymerase specialized sigma24 family protein
LRADQERDYVECVRARISRLHRVAYLVLGDGNRADDAVQNALTTL